MAFVIRLTPRSEFDARQIYRWIQARSPAGAFNWWLAFEIACDRLVEDPLSFGLSPEAEPVGKEVRQVLFQTRHGRPYRILSI
jgi:plasmid stabilization system protein ParE